MGDLSKSEIDTELDELRAAISQEEQAKEILSQSKDDLTKTIADLTNELQTVEEDDTEDDWKVRHDEQFDLNKHLEKQIIMLNDKMKELKEELANMGDNNNERPFELDDLNEVELKRAIKQLERDRLELDGTLRALDWQLDSEAKARYNLNEEIGEYRAGLIEAQGKVQNGRMKEVRPLGRSQKTENKNIKFNSLRGPRISSKDRYYGIPDNQRIIDPRKGPVKRTAAVGHLPKIESRDSNHSVKSSPGPQKPWKEVSPRGYNSADENRQQKYASYSRKSDPL